MSGHIGEIPHTSLPSVWWNFHREVSLTLFAFLSAFSLPVLDLLPQICYNNTWIILSKTTEQTRNQTVVNRTSYSSFFMPQFRKDVADMANRTRTNRNEFHLDDKEQYIRTGQNAYAAAWGFLQLVSDLFYFLLFWFCVCHMFIFLSLSI